MVTWEKRGIFSDKGKIREKESGKENSEGERKEKEESEELGGQ